MMFGLFLVLAATNPTPISPSATPKSIVIRTRELRAPTGDRIYSAREAVQAAADNRKVGVVGQFAFIVHATGWDHGRLFLNSEEDYRDPRNLSVSVDPDMARQLVGDAGNDGQQSFDNRIVLVRGRAVTTRINFTDDDGKPSGKYYYQTQVLVGSANQLKWIEWR